MQQQCELTNTQGNCHSTSANSRVKLSIVILCWNDLKVIADCLSSIFVGTQSIEFEVIVSDNGSTDGSVEHIHKEFPQVRVLQNGDNLGFAKGNNVGIRVAKGHYVLILNPDTIVHPGALERWISFADRHPEAGAFGCRVLNPDGTFQKCARPFPSVFREWISAFCLRPLGYLSRAFESDTYVYMGWNGDTEREIDWQSGCCVMFRADVLRELTGFDERFFYHYEEVDLCRRVWNAGFPILFTPEATITHLGGQSVKRFPVKFELEKNRNRYRYYYKHFGPSGARQCRQFSLVRLRIRQFLYTLSQVVLRTPEGKSRLDMYRVLAAWNKEIDPIQFVKKGKEPHVEPHSAA